jgi:hypothetical protein
VAAVREGTFHIWAVSRIEEGIELLTGIAAGEQGAFGTYPDGTLFQRVTAALDDMRLRAVEPGENGVHPGPRMTALEASAARTPAPKGRR